MRILVTLVLIFSAVVVFGKNTPQKPSVFREVSLQKVPLKKGERIASIQVTVALGYFHSLRIPFDWSFNVGTPISGVSELKGTAGHGSSMPFTTEEFQRFLTLEFDDSENLSHSSITVKLGLYLYDPKTNGESERTIELPLECVVLTEPNQALQHNDPSCHVLCLRTPRASRGRG